MERPGRDLNPGQKLRRLLGCPLPYRDSDPMNPGKCVAVLTLNICSSRVSDGFGDHSGKILVLALASLTNGIGTTRADGTTLNLLPSNQEIF